MKKATSVLLLFLAGCGIHTNASEPVVACAVLDNKDGIFMAPAPRRHAMVIAMPGPILWTEAGIGRNQIREQLDKRHLIVEPSEAPEEMSLLSRVLNPANRQEGAYVRIQLTPSAGPVPMVALIPPQKC